MGTASNFQGLAIPKPEARKRTKARLKRQFAKDRKACRAASYQRDGGCCVRCGTPLKLNLSDIGAYWFNVANIHEKLPRSLGGSALDTDNTETLCAECHTGQGFHAVERP